MSEKSKFSISRNNLLFVLSILLLSCGGKDTKLPSSTNLSERPNIVWLVFEDQSPDFLPIYGDNTQSLPTIEAIAKKGVIYDNAFSPAPVCAPARSAIITGMYPTTLGTHNMRTYNPNRNFNQPSIDIPVYSPLVPENVKVFTHYLKSNGYYCTNNAKEDYNFETPLATWDESGRKATWGNRPENSPFFAVFNFGITHESQIWKNGKKELFVNPDSIQVPPFFPNDSIVRHDLAVNYSNLKRLDQQLNKIIQQLKEDNLYDNTYIFFYGDHGGPFPRYKRSVYDTGIKIPLVVKYPKSVHFNTRNDELVSFIDFAPTVLSIAGINPPSYMQGKAFLGAYKSSEERNYIFAASDRFDECYDKRRVIRSKQFKYIKNYFPETPYAIPVSYRMQMPMMKHMVAMDSLNQLKGNQKLWFSKTKPKEEFYDIVKDPYELNNLASKSAYSSQIQIFRNELQDWVEETNDLGEYNEHTLVQKWLPNGYQEQLLKPLFNVNSNKLKISAPYKDATILWRFKRGQKWNNYSQPVQLKEGDTLESIATRIGLKNSDIATYY